MKGLKFWIKPLFSMFLGRWDNRFSCSSLISWWIYWISRIIKVIKMPWSIGECWNYTFAGCFKESQLFFTLNPFSPFPHFRPRPFKFQLQILNPALLRTSGEIRRFRLIMLHQSVFFQLCQSHLLLPYQILLIKLAASTQLFFPLKSQQPARPLLPLNWLLNSQLIFHRYAGLWRTERHLLFGNSPHKTFFSQSLLLFHSLHLIDPSTLFHVTDVVSLEK